MVRRLVLCLVASLLILPAASSGAAAQGDTVLSHPPTRPAVPASDSPLGNGPVLFVDTSRGDDANDGSESKPWKTINHALPHLAPGDTLCLREGVYFENVYCAVAGTREKPITIRAYPGERAIIDGGIPEFQTDPASAWEPAPDGKDGEYVSARAFRNIRDVIGLFGDSLIGLQTYWHRTDLQATNEQWITDEDTMVKPVYCGPGLWYDKMSGRIHARLAPTHIQNKRVSNYAGEADPRKLPLVVAPFNSVPLFVDQAMNVHFKDLIIRGGGLNSVVLQFGINLDFENVTIYCGTYGIRSRGTGPLHMVNCAVYGMAAPWAFRTENGLYTYTPDYYDPFLREFADPIPPQRNVARLMTHAVLVTEGSFEFEVFYYPHNHDWEIENCEFTDGHDGVYLSGKNIRFHHNWLDNFQDDALYVSAPTPYFNDSLFIYQNLISKSLMAFSCHSRGGPAGDVYIFRNVADLREGVNANRPSPKNPEGTLTTYHIYLMHGRGMLGVESLYFYQNTLLCGAYPGAFAHRTLYSTSASTSRRVFNNLFVYLNQYQNLRPPIPTRDIQCDGNLHWCSAAGVEPPAGFLEKVRTCEASEANKTNYPAGWAANSFVADPGFMTFDAGPDAANDYRLGKDSLAVGKGIMLPDVYEDPLRPADGKAPDIGAVPIGGEPLTVGVNRRITAGQQRLTQQGH